MGPIRTQWNLSSADTNGTYISVNSGTHLFSGHQRDPTFCPVLEPLFSRHQYRNGPTYMCISMGTMESALHIIYVLNFRKPHVLPRCVSTK